MFKFFCKAVIPLGIFGASLAFTQTLKLPTPIQHVIIIVQENRTPDDLFQDPVLVGNGADIQSASDAAAVPLGSCWDIGHSHGTSTSTGWELEYADQQGGKSFCNDGKDYSHCTTHPACPPDTYVENTAQDPVIQPYWDIARNYGFANYMFQSSEGPSFPAHQFLFSGTSQPDPYGDPSFYYEDFASGNEIHNNDGNVGCAATSTSQVNDINPQGIEGLYYNNGYPCYEHGTLSDLAEQAGFTSPWRYYGHDPHSPNNFWTAPNAIQHICRGTPGEKECPGKDFTEHVDLTDTDVVGDILSCNLAAVSWVIPDGKYSDHPGGTTPPYSNGGPDWVATIIGAVQGSQGACDGGKGYWADTVILVTWDDWGGFWDHVSPYEVLKNEPGTWGSGYVSGFRVPLLVVSAYMKSNGYVSGPCVPITNGINNNEVCLNKKAPYIHDVGSILNFTEYVLGLPQGGISQTSKSGWYFDDYWAPDYCGNPANLCDPVKYPYSLSDFFNFNQSPQPAIPIPTITYHTVQDFINLVGGNPEAPDMETP